METNSAVKKVIAKNNNIYRIIMSLIRQNIELSFVAETLPQYFYKDK